MKYVALFLVVFISITANLPNGMIARFGVDPNYLIATLAAVVITWLALNRHVLLVVMVGILCIAANVPEATAARIGYDRDIMLATMVALLLIHPIRRLFGWD